PAQPAGVRRKRCRRSAEPACPRGLRRRRLVRTRGRDREDARVPEALAVSTAVVGMKTKRRVIWILLLPLYAACSTTYLGHSGQRSGSNWRTASRESVGLAPDPATTREAVVQVYAARTIGWRGYFGVHTWIAVKPRHADHLTIHQGLGHPLARGRTV